MSATEAHIDVFGRTDIGRRRERNEDHFLTARLGKTLEVQQSNLEAGDWIRGLATTEAWLLMVADGVAGSTSGDEASSTAVRMLAEHLGHVVSCYYHADVETEHEFLAGLEEAVDRAHQKVLDDATRGGGSAATTLTLVTMVWPRAYLVHIGDSRCYHLRHGRLRQVTQDQTLAELMVDTGAMTADAATAAGMDNVLTSAIGSKSARPTIGLIDLEIGDSIVVCSDGLTRHVGDDYMLATLTEEESAEAACNRLVDAALAGGGRDNISVIVARAGGG
jgi:protein phosphatase